MYVQIGVIIIFFFFFFFFLTRKKKKTKTQEHAQDPSQRYKEGKYIIEKLLVKKLVQTAPWNWSMKTVSSNVSSTMSSEDFSESS